MQIDTALHIASCLKILPTSPPAGIIWHGVDRQLAIGQSLVLADNAVADHDHHALRRHAIYHNEEGRCSRR